MWGGPAATPASAHGCRGGGRGIPAAPPRRGRPASATPARRAPLTVTPAAPSRVERGARGPTARGAQARDTLAGSASPWPSRSTPGLGGAQRQRGCGRASPESRRQVVAGRRGMRYRRPQHASPSQVTGRPAGAVRDTRPREGTRASARAERGDGAACGRFPLLWLAPASRPRTLGSQSS